MKYQKKIFNILMLAVLLFTLVVPVFATESITQDEFYANVNAEGTGFRIEFGKGDNKRNLVIWSFYEFDDENENHKFEENELIVAIYRFHADQIKSKGRHLPTTNIDEEYLWYRVKWNDGTTLELRIFIRPPNLEIEIKLIDYEKVQAWNDLTIIYEVNGKGKDATFAYQATEVKIVEKLNPNFIDQLLESLPF